MPGLTDKLKRIADAEGVRREELILAEAEAFLEEHKGHGGYRIELNYDPNDNLMEIHVVCDAGLLEHTYDCPHYTPETEVELQSSVIYSRRQVIETVVQEARRNPKKLYH